MSCVVGTRREKSERVWRKSNDWYRINDSCEKTVEETGGLLRHHKDRYVFPLRP